MFKSYSKFFANNLGSRSFSQSSQSVRIGVVSGCHSSGSAESSPMAHKAVPVQGSFDRIEQSGVFDVEWAPAAETSVEIHAQEHVLPMMDVYVRNGTLVVASKPGSFSCTERIVVRVQSPSLTHVEAAGSGDIWVSDVPGPALTVELSGSGAVRASGHVERLSVSLAGSGEFDGSQLRATHAELSVAGSGDIRAVVAQDVVAKVTGSGDIAIRGAAGNRNTRIMGSGDIRFY